MFKKMAAARKRVAALVLATATLAMVAVAPQVGGAAAPRAAAPASHGILVIEGAADPTGIPAMAAVIASTAVPGEHLLVVDPGAQPDGSVLVSSEAPGAESVALPSAPNAPSDPTEFQQASYEHRLAAWRATTAQLRRRVHNETTAALSRWATSLARVLGRSPDPSPENPGIGPALDDAATSLLGLEQAGVATAGHSAVVVVGQMGSPATPVPAVPAILAGATVVLEGFSGDTVAQAAWQGAFIEAGASRAAVVSGTASFAADDLIDQSLAGRATRQPTAAVYFSLGQATLTSANTEALSSALRLLTVTYPHAPASVVGTGDAIGGAVNGPLAAARAAATAAWLVAHGIAASRLVVVGAGPTSAYFDPGSRRVLVVVDPVHGG
ncbi:MAG TPA: hypothetical protein VIJ56_12940 [Acidimicrobiales bacterium]